MVDIDKDDPKVLAERIRAWVLANEKNAIQGRFAGSRVTLRSGETEVVALIELRVQVDSQDDRLKIVRNYSAPLVNDLGTPYSREAHDRIVAYVNKVLDIALSDERLVS